MQTLFLETPETGYHYHYGTEDGETTEVGDLPPTWDTDGPVDEVGEGCEE